MQLNSSYKIVDFFNSFNAKNGGTKNRYAKRPQDFNKVIRAYNDIASSQVVENGSQYLPKIGKMKIVKFRMIKNNGKTVRARSVDHLESKRQKKTVYYLNAHSDGFIMKTLWVPASTLSYPKCAYSFTATRRYNREKKGKAIKNGKIDYQLEILR